MRLLCVEDVGRFGFDLYFLAFTTETPPVPDNPGHHDNREWCYQRHYTTLEIQVARGGNSKTLQARTSRNCPEEATCEGITVYVADSEKERDVIDPDGLIVALRHGRRYGVTLGPEPRA